VVTLRKNIKALVLLCSFFCLIILAILSIVLIKNGKAKQGTQNANVSGSDIGVKNNCLKIVVACHKPTEFLEDTRVFVPVHVGRALNPSINTRESSLKTEDKKDLETKRRNYDWMLGNMRGDNEGNNISDKNRRFSELTATYWLWKNYNSIGGPEYCGIMHYRRHLNFNSSQREQRGFYGETVEKINSGYQKDCCLNLEAMAERIKEYDIVVPHADFVGDFGASNAYEECVKNHGKDYIGMMFEVIDEKYPEYKQDVENLKNETAIYTCNMFIMKKACFEEYCNFLFDVLLKVSEKIDSSGFSNAKEIMGKEGYLGEKLTNLYIQHKKRTSQVKILELNKTFVKNTDIKVS
jgi:hypothetical protein